MEFFRIIAVGEHFDVDGFLGATRLHSDEVWHKGAMFTDGDFSCEEDKYPNSGFITFLGDENVLDLYEQYDEAYSFLERNRDALSKLVR